MALEEADAQTPEESSAQTATELPPPPLVTVGPAKVGDDDSEPAEERGDDISGDEPAPS